MHSLSPFLRTSVFYNPTKTDTAFTEIIEMWFTDTSEVEEESEILQINIIIIFSTHTAQCLDLRATKKK